MKLQHELGKIVSLLRLVAVLRTDINSDENATCPLPLISSPLFARVLSKRPSPIATHISDDIRKKATKSHDYLSAHLSCPKHTLSWLALECRRRGVTICPVSWYSGQTRQKLCVESSLTFVNHILNSLKMEWSLKLSNEIYIVGGWSRLLGKMC
jgi:hypothetical protein